MKQPYRNPPDRQPSRFDEAMQRCGDAELFVILAEPADNWQPEAIEAARAEIARRNLEAPERETFAKEATVAVKRARAGLDLHLKIAGFIMGATGLGMIVFLFWWGFYKRSGETRKSRELAGWTASGIAFTIIVTFIFGHIVHR